MLHTGAVESGSSGVRLRLRAVEVKAEAQLIISSPYAEPTSTLRHNVFVLEPDASCFEETEQESACLETKLDSWLLTQLFTLHVTL